MLRVIAMLMISGQVVATVPNTPDADAYYLIYLHGKAIEDAGRRPTTEFGVYEYDQILQTLADRGFVVISETRPRDTDPSQYAHKVVTEIRDLMRKGVSPTHVSVVGASKGAVIAMLVSTYLQRRDISFALMGNCNSAILRSFRPKLSGRILSIYESDDEFGGSCEQFRGAGRAISEYEEITLHTGLRHGFLYGPLQEWVEPVVNWAHGHSRRASNAGFSR